jgi:hypothetical protein
MYSARLLVVAVNLRRRQRAESSGSESKVVPAANFIPARSGRAWAKLPFGIEGMDAAELLRRGAVARFVL